MPQSHDASALPLDKTWECTVLRALTSASSISNRKSEMSSCSSSGVPPSICIFSPSGSSAQTAVLCWACARMVLQTGLSEARMNDVTDGSILNVLDGVTGLSQADTARRSCEGIRTGITHWSLICRTANKYYVYLDALFDPEVRSHCFPVLKKKHDHHAWNKKERIKQTSKETSFFLQQITKMRFIKTFAVVNFNEKSYLRAENVKKSIVQLLLHGFIEHL